MKGTGSKSNYNVSLSILRHSIKITMDKWNVLSWFVIELKHYNYIVFVSFQDVLLVSMAVTVPIDACVVMEENVIMWQEDVHARLAGSEEPANTVSFWHTSNFFETSQTCIYFKRMHIHTGKDYCKSVWEKELDILNCHEVHLITGQVLISFLVTCYDPFILGSLP